MYGFHQCWIRQQLALEIRGTAIPQFLLGNVLWGNVISIARRYHTMDLINRDGSFGPYVAPSKFGHVDLNSSGKLALFWL